MSLPPPIFDGFFRNPFGGEMNPVGGMGGEVGVLEIYNNKFLKMVKRYKHYKVV